MSPFGCCRPQKDLQSIEYVISREASATSWCVWRSAAISYFDTRDIRERMYMEPASFQLRHGRYSEAFLKRDEESIASLYHSNGFRDVKINSHVDRDYKGKTGDVRVSVDHRRRPAVVRG